MTEFALVWAWVLIALVVFVAVVVWRGGAVDRDKARGSLSAWWRRVRGRD